MPKIHPSAIVSSEACLGDGVEIGPYAIIDGAVKLGEGCVVHAHGRVIGPLTMGKGCSVHSGAVIGGSPQDRKYKNEPSDVVIGEENIFRENVTIHRGTAAGTRTVIGHRNFFMVGAHVAHNAVVGNDVTFINGATLAGHAQIGDRAILGAYCAVHQFCRIGRLAMVSNYAGLNVDFPPFFLTMTTNAIHQLNAVGLRRSGMPRSSIDALRRMFQLAFREQHSRPLRVALAELPAEVSGVAEVQEVIAFCGASKRGVARFVPWSRQKNMLHVDGAEE